MTTSFHLNGGCDVGNGFVKTVIENSAGSLRDVIDMPSSVSTMTRPNMLPTPDEKAVGELLDGDFYNHLDASFVSPLVPDQYRRIFGTRSLSADGAFEEFDTAGRVSKARQPLSKILVLGMFAAKALRDYAVVNQGLPTTELQVTARAALALPVAEFMRHREVYANEFLAPSGGHLVTIHNFETKVSVRIVFADVQVLAEGASAQYAITDKGEPLMQAMLADVRSLGGEQVQLLAGITAQDVMQATNTIGIDVGDGTTGLIAFTNAKFNADVSRSFDKGYGSVLTNALKAMEDQGLNSGFSSRKELADFLLREPSPLKRGLHTRVTQFVEEEARFFASEVAEQLGKLLRVVGASTEVGFVYGGGSGPMKEILYPVLLQKVKEMNSLGVFPVLYLDARYSRHLNREGLFIAVKAIEAKAVSLEEQKASGRRAAAAVKI